MSAGNDMWDGIHLVWDAAAAVKESLTALGNNEEDIELRPLVKGIYDDAPHDGKNGPVGVVEVSVKKDSDSLNAGASWTVIVL